MSWMENENILKVLEETRSKLLARERELDEQLIYVTELEEAVRMLAEKVEAQSSQISEQEVLNRNLSKASSIAKLDWERKLKYTESAYKEKVETLSSELVKITKENDELLEHIDSLEDRINDQQSALLDMEAYIASFQINPSLEELDRPVERELHCEHGEELDTSLLSNGSDDEDLSPIDVKISRDLSGKSSAHRRASFASLTQGVDASFMHLRPASLNGHMHEHTSSLSQMDEMTYPPKPPPVNASQIQNIDSKESYPEMSKEASKFIPQPLNSAWQNRKKHVDLFSPVANDKYQRTSTYQWYVKGKDAGRKYNVADDG